MNDRRRRLSALSWLIVAGVLIKAASGGGVDPGSIRYFAEHEPPVSYAIGAVVLGVSLALVLAFAQSRWASLPVLSAGLSIPTVVYSAYLVTHDHNSAFVLGAAAIGAFTLAAPAARRQLATRRVGSRSRRDADEVERDR